MTRYFWIVCWLLGTLGASAQVPVASSWNAGRAAWAERDSATSLLAFRRGVAQAAASRDTAQWLQALDSLALYSQRFGANASKAHALRVVDTLLFYHGHDLSQPWRDVDQSTQVPMTELSGVWFIEDSLEQLSLGQVMADSLGTKGYISSREARLGEKANWVRLRLRSRDSLLRSFFLLFGRSEETWYKIDVFVPNGKGAYVRQRTGYGQQLEGKRWHEYDSQVEVVVPPDEVITVYARLEKPLDNRRQELKVIHWDYPTVLAKKSRARHLSGIFFGIILIQSIYYLLLFFSSRDVSYLYYVIYMIGLGAFAFTAQYLEPWLPGRGGEIWELYAILIATGMCFIGFIKFTAAFLQADTYIPIARKRLKWYIGIFLGLAIALTLAATYLNITRGAPGRAPTIAFLVLLLTAILGIIAMIVAGLILCLIMAIRTYRAGYPPARYFLYAQICLFLGVAVPLYIGFMNLSPGGPYVTSNTLILILEGGITAQLSLMALGIGQKRRMLEQEKLEAEQTLNKELQRLNDAFSRFVPHEFLGAIGKETVLEVGLGDGVEQEVTVLFSDIRGYTTLSEQMTPEETFRFLNEYLGKVGPVIRDHKGFVNQFYGDGIMALFIQAPEQAVVAAVEMQRAIAEFNQTRSMPIRVGIGLHSGELMMGVIGDHNRFDAGVVADAVNTAARMEGLTKYYGASLLISETVFEQLPDSFDMAHRFIARVKVKGRSQPLAVYDVFEADPPEVFQCKEQSLGYFNRGMNAFQQQDFDQAIEALEAALRIYPDDMSAKRFLSQARQYQQHGAPDDWTGVDEMLKK